VIAISQIVIVIAILAIVIEATATWIVGVKPGSVTKGMDGTIEIGPAIGEIVIASTLPIASAVIGTVGGTTIDFSTPTGGVADIVATTGDSGATLPSGTIGPGTGGRG
jgi:hypothetical protein